MSVSFYKSFSTEDCPICLGTMEGTSVAAHTNGGQLHPMHESCIKIWAQVKNNCPVCQAPIQTNSLFSWKERVVLLGRDIKKDVLLGASVGLATFGLVNVLDQAGVVNPFGFDISINEDFVGRGPIQLVYAAAMASMIVIPLIAKAVVRATGIEQDAAMEGTIEAIVGVGGALGCAAKQVKILGTQSLSHVYLGCVLGGAAAAVVARALFKALR
jgi:hypothetical protein